ncbi:U6 snRNA phosphodiesterase 1-like [Antedon mediterranea]|uniref:U6 snRNA phosphodiesterase 1-like n=1 Tax=Antedon mediterranea TaxID=105859 RepID=UPI003AF76291
MSGLCSIQSAYGSSDTDSSDEENHQKKRGILPRPEPTTDLVVGKRGVDVFQCPTPHTETDAKRPRLTRTESNGSKSTSDFLPLPDEVMSMFLGDRASDASSSNHQGRVRSFAHEAGNWATYVYVPIEITSGLEDIVSALHECIPTEYNIQPMDILHLSVSKTVTLKYHWIRPFTELLSQRLAELPQFICAFGKPRVYVNDEATRSFVSLTIGQGVKELEDIVKEVDLALNEFNLPPFYKPASFHVSIGWCLGNITKDISTEALSNLERCFLEHFSSLKPSWNVTKLCSKIGNKCFAFPLS